MSLTKKHQKINPDDIILEEIDLNAKPSLKERSKSLYKPLIILLLISGTFGMVNLGIADASKPLITIQNKLDLEASGSPSNFSEKKGSGSFSNINTSQIFGSKNGTKYYFASCKTSKRIKEENRVFFSSEKEAKLAGYTLALTCHRPL